jgi:hypothetical protein
MNKEKYIKIFKDKNKNFSWIKFIRDNKLKNVNGKEDLFNYFYQNRIVNINSYNKNNFEDFLKNNSLNKIKVSSSIKQFENNIINKYKLNSYNSLIDNNEPVIFFGLYNTNDLKVILNHKGEKYIMFGGSDIDLNAFSFLIQKYNLLKFKFISISKNIYDRLLKKNILSFFVYFNLVDKKIFYPIEYKKKDTIYIYNGFKKGLESRYGKEIYEKVMKRLPHFKYILSNELNIENKEMPNVYKKCFIGLRLTLKDGNANTVQEFDAMKIPIIHNQSDYGLKWNNTDDIVEIINKYSEIDDSSIIDIDSNLLGLKIDFYNLNKLDDIKTKVINNNLYLLINKIKKYKKILFICSDYPGYGGAATNCHNLFEFFSENHDTRVLYYSKLLNLKKNKNIYYSDYKNIRNVLKDIKLWNPDLIILKNFFFMNLKKIFNNTHIIYLIAGIYHDFLDKNYKELKNLNEQKKYINEKVLIQINNSDESYCNSSHTQDILKNKFNLNTNLFYSSLIKYFRIPINKFNIFNREYNFGFIVSNFDRKIKNIDETIEFLKNKKKVILIGKNSSRYKKYGFECKELIDSKLMESYYKKIKFVVQKSHFESCSNVKIESLYNGCKIINNFNKKILVCSTQYPGYGGAATNAYLIVKFLRSKGYKACGLFFHNNINVNYDPDKIGGIYLFSNKYTFFSKQFKNYKERLYYSNYKLIKDKIKTFLNGSPDICFAKNYVAPYICKKIFNCRTIYLVSGIKYFKDNNKLTAIDFLKKDYKINIKKSLSYYYEKQSLEVSDMIVCNSNLTKKLFLKLNPDYSNKLFDNVLNTSNILYNKTKIVNKNIDIIFICSRMDRTQKNPELVKKIFEDKRLDKYKKVVIGDQSINYFRNIKNITCYNLLTQKECIEHMKKSKFLLIPSFFDSSPNVCLEAYYNNCIPIISKNIGGYENFHDYLICNNLLSEEWIGRIIKLLKNYKYSKNLINKIKFDDVLFEHLIY